ncbi:MAG TPA: hypothetical protein VJT75_05860 [Thermoleophilaceae bacterium]|nr:hypothetical protein [Thermoleophilaceae bacterium]
MPRTIRDTLIATAVGLTLGATPAAAAPTPIPEGPDGGPPPPLIGKPAVQRPVTAPRVPRHPFMAPNDRSNLHNDAFQTDANRGPGPLGRGMRRASTFFANDCASITFDSRGRIVSVCVGLIRPTLYMLDPKTLDTLASMPLPPKERPSSTPFQDFSGGGYFYLDHRDRAVMLTNDRHLYVVRETPGPGFAIERDYDLNGAIGLMDKPFSALPDWSGRYWFVTTNGVVGTVNRGTGKVQSLDLPGDEGIQNSFSIDTDGGVYIVSNVALYRFDAGPGGEPKVTWRAVYPNSGIHKPGQADASSGTTPTLMKGGLVAITDNADPTHIVVYRKAPKVAGGRVVCRHPIFKKGASATDQSLNVAGRAIVAENNYGYTGPPATQDGASTTPGLTRVDLDRDGTGCHHVWTSREIAPTVVPKISLPNGLVYTYTKPAREDGSDFWYLTALDFRTGKRVYSFRAGEGLGYNNNYAPITIGPDNGAVYIGVLGGMAMLRDAAPPPRHPPRVRPKAKPKLFLGVRWRRPCAFGHVRAKVRGKDVPKVASAVFLVGKRRVGRDFSRPYRRRIRLTRTKHDRIYTIRARVRLVDGRKKTVHRKVRVCRR